MGAKFFERGGGGQQVDGEGVSTASLFLQRALFVFFVVGDSG